jgi:hypothetical protein
MTLALVPLMVQAVSLTGPLAWDRLPAMPWEQTPQVTPDLTRFVIDEVKAQRCPAPRSRTRIMTMDADVAVLLQADGTIRATVPRAINCPTVEQYAAGLIASFARNNLRESAEGWYRATVTFRWRR